MSLSYGFCVFDYRGGLDFHLECQLLQADALKITTNQTDHAVFEISYGIGRVSAW